MTDATGRGGVDCRDKGLDEAELLRGAFATVDCGVARGEEVGRKYWTGGKVGGSMEGQLGWAFEANVIFLSGVVNTSSSRGIGLMSKLGDNFPSISVSSRFPLAPDNLLSAGKGIDLGFSVQGLFF